MTSLRVKRPFAVLFATVLAGLFTTMSPAPAQDKDKAGPEKIPQKVVDALEARFPNLKIQKWTKEEEDGIVLYDVEFTQAGQKLEADIKADGAIHNWEKAIAVKDLPPVVRKAADTRYPKAAIREAMAVTAVKNGKEALEGYEILLITAAKKEVEITVAPDGKILEDAGGRE